jgi:hypothetical protein
MNTTKTLAEALQLCLQKIHWLEHQLDNTYRPAYNADPEIEKARQALRTYQEWSAKQC